MCLACRGRVQYGGSGASTCTASAMRRFFLRTRGAGAGAGEAAPVSRSAPTCILNSVIQSKLSQVAGPGVLGAQQSKMHTELA